MAILLADAGNRRHLMPLTSTRPVGALRPGVLTIANAWERLTEQQVGFRTAPHLRTKYPEVADGLVREVDGALLPTPDLVVAVLALEPGEVLVRNGRALAFCRQQQGTATDQDWDAPPAGLVRREYDLEVVAFRRPWDLFRYCDKAIINDYALLTDGRRSAPISALNTIIGDPALIFLEPGARVEACILNTTNGPIHIGRDAEVMEGCMVRGPFALGDRAQLKMGAKVYGATAIGPECRVGGEVSNSVIMGYSNKGHDGFLGNSVLGEWCNLGADTNTSNLKNTYGEVKVWNAVDRQPVPTGLQFCGLIMGDHGRAGINTMFNTGTVAGVCANIFDGGFPPKYIPDFAWGGAAGFDTYDLAKACGNAARMMERRGVPFTDADAAILEHIFHHERQQ